MNKDLKTPKEEKNLVLVIENASTKLKRILNDALMLGYAKSITKALVNELIKETTKELKEMEAPDDLIKSTEIGLKQTFLRQYATMLTILEKRKKEDSSGMIAFVLKQLKSNVPIEVGKKGGIVLADINNKLGIADASINNLRDFMTEVEEAAGARYVDYANMVQETIVEIGDKIADGTLTEVDSLGRHKSLRNMAEITVRYNLIVDDVKRMGSDVKFVVGSSHPNASERCSYWQGKIFLMDIDVATREMGQFDKNNPPTPKVIGFIDGKPYYSLKQACENGFLSYNCQHRLVKYYTGINPPQYSFFQVNGARNITTRQRVLENRVRQYKAREEISNPNVKVKRIDPFTGISRVMSQRRYNELMSKYWQQQYETFSRQVGAPIYKWRLRITETERVVRGI